MILHLHQSIPYHIQKDFPSPYTQAYTVLEKLPVGSEACIGYEMHVQEETISHTPLFCYIFESGKELPSIGELPKGSYLFQQLPIAPQQDNELILYCNGFFTKIPASVHSVIPYYIRLYKEKAFEIAVQILSPIQTTKE